MHTEIESMARHYNEVFVFIRVNIGYINLTYNHQKLLYKLAETILYQECYSKNTWSSFINQNLLTIC